MHRIAVIPGDGVGPEVIAEGKKVLEAAGERFGFDIHWKEFNFGSDRYLATGELITEEELRRLAKYKALYFGAIGDGRVKPGILEKGILLTLRFYFDQYINLRPVKLLNGVWTPLANKTPKDIDFIVVRENTEDFYISVGSRFNKSETKEFNVIRQLYSIKFGLEATSDAEEIAYQIGVLSREGTRRVIRYAFNLARVRRKKLSSVDKANVLTDMYSLWRDVFTEEAQSFPDITTEFNFVDAIAMWFVKNPEWYDVVVTPNMYGDILTDLGAMIQGGLGLAPGGNINPQGTSMFEPIHGSAPKYKGLGIVNPIATIWAGSMLLDSIGEHDAAAMVLSAIENSIMTGVKTRDLGGDATTAEVGTAIAKFVVSS